MRPAIPALLAAAMLTAVSATAQSYIEVGPQALMGVPIGTEAEAAVAALKAVLGPGDDSGWSDGCELNGIKERYINWGGLTASFEETYELGNRFVNWNYGLDFETGGPVPGGPLPDQFLLPQGVRVGQSFSDAVRIYGVDPEVDDVFGIGIYNNQYFEMLTADENLDGPIAQIAVPHFSYCE